MGRTCGKPDAIKKNPTRNVSPLFLSKAAELWGQWPEVGGFLVKADSEGNVGPAHFNRTQADGTRQEPSESTQAGVHSISFGSPHACPVGHTCGEPDEIKEKNPTRKT